MSKKTTKELVLEGRDEGKVVFLQYDGSGFAVISAPVDEFIKQPADGILYDLNRLEEITLTYIDDPKWVNDFAVALTIRALKDKLEPWWKQMSNEDIAAELSATFDLGLDITRQIADWILTIPTQRAKT